MKRKFRTLVLACTAILLCIGLMTIGTFALYTDKASVTNHLQAGNLNITLIRDKLTSYELNKKGFLEEVIDDQNRNFTSTTENNIFGLEETDKIVPLSSYKADMIVSNCSDVAFGYYLEIKLSDNSDLELAKQLKVTVDTGTEKSVYLSDGLMIGSETSFLGVVPVGENSNFSVTILFEDLENNNASMNQDVYFDLIVHAVQVVNE